MTRSTSEPNAPLLGEDASAGPTGPSSVTKEYEDQPHLSYQGSRVPFIVVLIWLVFVTWGIVYLLRWIPKSWQEWFSR